MDGKVERNSDNVRLKAACRNLVSAQVQGKVGKRREGGVLFPVTVPILADCNSVALGMEAWVQSHKTELLRRTPRFSEPQYSHLLNLSVGLREY